MARRRKMSSTSPQVDHRIFSIYSLTISFVYMLRIAFELVAQKTQENDIQWQENSRKFPFQRISLISISWTIWMFINTIFALFVVNSDIIQLVIKRIQTHIVFSAVDVVKFILDIIHFFNIPISLYFICVFLVSSKTHKRRRTTSRKNKAVPADKNIIKKQFEVSNVFVGDEMVYYV
ncbi:Protein CBG15655 [Caenorhabditis briggsae]|uniref:Protein CBG15655 n=1 Tax=Caenorhabditis briggsae TaxID=6238 RepID=A8XMG8_CAEBR|nr:Protein CBG15655 [Caenorhabditis briggsae]CAP33844.2 Protein CBG15655 [Caenorhabditis briggsae]